MCAYQGLHWPHPAGLRKLRRPPSCPPLPLPGTVSRGGGGAGSWGPGPREGGPQRVATLARGSRAAKPAEVLSQQAPKTAGSPCRPPTGSLHVPKDWAGGAGPGTSRHRAQSRGGTFHCTPSITHKTLRSLQGLPHFSPRGEAASQSGPGVHAGPHGCAPASSPTLVCRSGWSGGERTDAAPPAPQGSRAVSVSQLASRGLQQQALAAVCF